MSTVENDEKRNGSSRGRAVNLGVRAHDRQQLEIEAFWPVERDGRDREYHLEMYLFVPPDLRMSSAAFSARDFYADLHARLRYAPADLSGAELLSSREERSPLTRLRRRLQTDPRAEVFPEDAWVYELKALGCLFRTHVRTVSRRLAERLMRVLAGGPGETPVARPKRLVFGDATCEEEGSSPSVSSGGGGGAGGGEREEEKTGPSLGFSSAAVEDALAFCRETADILKAFRELRREAEPKVPPATAKAFELVDEYLSIQGEYGALCLLREATAGAEGASGDATEKKTVLKPLLAEAEYLTRAEVAYRRARGFSTVVVRPDENQGAATELRNEFFHVRKRLLRRYTETILALQDVSRGEAARNWAVQLAYSVAAAVAMTVALLAAWLTDTLSGVRLSLTTLLTIAVAYAFKDRTKELLRLWFHKRLAGWFPDRRTDLQDPFSKLMIGTCRETVSFPRPKSLSPEVAAARDRHVFDDLGALWRIDERILKYERNVRLRPNAIFTQHRRVPAISDTLLFNLRPFMRRLGQPKRPLLYVEQGTEGSRVRKVEALKAHHLNVVLCWTARTGKKTESGLGRCRVILHRDGIERIECVETFGAAAKGNTGKDEGRR